MWYFIFFKAMVLLFLVFKADKHKREICWTDTMKIWVYCAEGKLGIWGSWLQAGTGSTIQKRKDAKII